MKVCYHLPLHYLSWLPCQRELDCDKAISYYKLQHSAISSTLIFDQPYLSQDWGIAHQPFHPHNLLKSTSVASPRTTLLPFNECSVGFASALSPLSSPTLPKPHYPTKIAITLASPRKRGGGTADTNFSLAVQYSDSPAFTILKLFRAVTVGIEIDRSTIFKSSKQTQSPPSWRQKV